MRSKFNADFYTLYTILVLKTLIFSESIITCHFQNNLKVINTENNGGRQENTEVHPLTCQISSVFNIKGLMKGMVVFGFI